jgi:hypothetical protein
MSSKDVQKELYSLKILKVCDVNTTQRSITNDIEIQTRQKFSGIKNDIKSDGREKCSKLQI